VYLEQTYGVSERRACHVVSLHRSTKRRQPGTSARRELVAHIYALSERHPRFGDRKIYALLKGEHWRVSRETVRGIRKREGLQVIKKERPRRPVAVSTPTPTRAAYPMCVGIVAGSSQKLLRSVAIRPDSVPRTANLNVVYQLRV
jgi:putative transposase